MIRLSALGLACALLAGCAMDQSELDSTASAVLRGVENTTDTAVVALRAFDNFSCSGTLIAPRVVVTAAHCLPPHLDDTLPGITIEDMEIYFGNNANKDDAEAIPAVDFAIRSWNDDQIEGDIGLIALEFAATIEPMPYATETPPDNAPVRMIGFGANNENKTAGSGIRREGMGTMSYLTGSGAWVYSEDATLCPGDSGGAAFVMQDGVEVVAMVNSRGGCVQDADSYHERIDYYVSDFIEPFIADNPPGSCERDGICARGCDDVDPDCPCATDGFCSLQCETWPLDRDCDNGPRECGADGTCVRDICKTPDPDCPIAGQCEADGVCDGECTDDPDCGNSADGDGGGCSTSGGDAGGLWFLAMAGLALLRRRH